MGWTRLGVCWLGMMGVGGLGLVAQGAPPVNPRDQLRTTILQTLINDPELGQYPLAASVGPDDQVILQGTLPSQQDKQLAERLVKSIPGVKKLSDRITVNAGAAALGAVPAATPAGNAEAAPPDPAMAVQRALNSHQELAHITAAAVQGAIVLSGAVTSIQARALAEHIAKQYAPGLALRDRITVRRPAHKRDARRNGPA